MVSLMACLMVNVMANLMEAMKVDRTALLLRKMKERMRAQM